MNNGYNPELLQQQNHGIHPANFPSTSSNPFPDFSAQQMNGSANMNSQMRPHSQSPAQMQNSSFNPIAQWGQHAAMLPQHQWPVQSQFMQNGMNAVMNGMHNMPMNMNMNIPAFNMPMFPQMLNDALALSQSPVAGEHDERLLIDTLVDATTRKENYRNAMNKMHGRNGHSASLWKDFYLEHRDRIDALVSQALKDKPPIIKAAKKPTLDSFHPEPSPPSSPAEARKRNSSSRPMKASASRSSFPNSSSPLFPSKNGRRSTINSLTTHTASYNSRLPPPNAEIKIPDPPSRSPSPPTKIVPHKGRGNKFTDEDKEFFIKFISWRLKCDPSLTRNALCDQLAEKAPHHSLQSWFSYWSNNHDLPDKILAAAYGEEAEDEDTDDESSLTEEEEIEPPSRRQPKYKAESSSEEEDQDAEGDDDHGDGHNNFTLPSFDESAMGHAGGAFTDADLALTSRYVASFDDFVSAPFGKKWAPWGLRHPQRSAKSWAEYYRKNERDILALAKKIKKAGAARGISPKRESSERANLAWASSPDASGPPKAKRKFVPDDQDSDTGSRPKMGKNE